MKDVHILGAGGVSSNVDRSRQEEGGGLAVSGHPFHHSLFKRGEGLSRSFYHHLLSFKVKKRDKQELSTVFI